LLARETALPRDAAQTVFHMRAYFSNGVSAAVARRVSEQRGQRQVVVGMDL